MKKIILTLMVALSFVSYSDAQVRDSISKRKAGMQKTETMQDTSTSNKNKIKMPGVPAQEQQKMRTDSITNGTLPPNRR